MWNGGGPRTVSELIFCHLTATAFFNVNPVATHPGSPRQGAGWPQVRKPVQPPGCLKPQEVDSASESRRNSVQLQPPQTLRSVTVLLLLAAALSYAISEAVRLTAQPGMCIFLCINLSLRLLGAIYTSGKCIVRIYGLQP